MTSPGKKRSTASHTARRRYLDAGLQVLADQGHAGLKQATVCAAVGATTGSFYHAFPSWSDYTSALIRHWRTEQSERPIEQAGAEPDPARRLDVLTVIALSLPHDTEAAIRVWAEHDSDVRAVQEEADEQRRQFIAETYAQVLGDRVLADRFATAAMYLLVGYENGTYRSRETLEWAFRVFIEQAVRDAADRA
ncbi:TetR/AcrR family transcriptional regulator [Gordonia sp. LSe1-13]|uniref:TetR/AcrR family transcriptional regulator n=1 Tax=Gordonia sesuvii TaxID=3116777 RepID=A0ABU7MEU0_9ACTN|nr:TetR/AcrR family transcriptional regulator [Gordonia sp. LSe1-13]